MGRYLECRNRLLSVMTEAMQNPSDTLGGYPKVAVLKPWQLTLTLILVTLAPFSLVVLLYKSFPVGKDPVLDASMSVIAKAWPNPDAPNARLVPGVLLKNTSDGSWDNINMSINDQFHYAHVGQLAGGKDMFVPLKFFRTKGNQDFPPDYQPFRLLTVYAQIPSKARAIVEVEGRELDGVQHLKGSLDMFAGDAESTE